MAVQMLVDLNGAEPSITGTIRTLHSDGSLIYKDSTGTVWSSQRKSGSALSEFETGDPIRIERGDKGTATITRDRISDTAKKPAEMVVALHSAKPTVGATILGFQESLKGRFTYKDDDGKEWYSVRVSGSELSEFKVGDAITIARAPDDKNGTVTLVTVASPVRLEVVATKATVLASAPHSKQTAVEYLKGTAILRANPNHFIAALSQLAAEKGWSRQALCHMAGTKTLSAALELSMQSGVAPETKPVYDYLGRHYCTLEGGTTTKRFTPYEGTPAQNLAIDRATFSRPAKRYIGVGLTDLYGSAGLTLPEAVKQTTIRVVGGGVAGLMASHALAGAGFANVRVLERHKELGGIWTRDNVRKGSRNNPRGLNFMNKALAAAPGDGQSVIDFARALKLDRETLGKDVKRINPAPFATTVHFENGESETVPIVINAIGLGRPKPASDPSRMTTNQSGGVRWQQILSVEEVRRRRFLFVGLGNSTAEMVRQMHKYMDVGIDCDYRILTHYPLDAVRNPTDTVVHRGRKVRVFRDTTFNLVDYQGDLQENREDYFRALHSGRIFSDIYRWHVRAKGGIDVYRNHKRKAAESLKEVDRIYTLIGYQHSVETLRTFGCSSYPDGSPRYDYDGEIFEDGHELHKGYFGFGAVLDAPWNPNAIVIPGMMSRIGDLVLGVIMRAFEYQERQGVAF